MKKIGLVALLVIMSLIGWISYITMPGEEDHSEEIAQYQQFAKEQMELEAYGTAIEYYTKVVELENTVENNKELAQAYNKAGRTKGYLAILETMISTFPNDSYAYKELSRYYESATSYEECVTVLKQAFAKGINEEELTERYYNTAYQFEILAKGLTEAYRFYGDYAVVNSNGKQALITSAMKNVGKEYEEVSPMVETMSAVKEGDKVYYIDSEGQKYMESKQKLEKAYSFSEGASVCQIEGNYRYLNSMDGLVLEAYEDATLFRNGIAAVKKANKWSIINKQGKPITSQTYQSVLVDEEHICSNQGVVFAGEESEYKMINLEGEEVSTQVYEDAKPFFEENITAVKIDGKWGFVTNEGEMVIEPQYEDARTFGGGLAAVKKDGKWGFITRKNVMVIEPQFEDARSFSTNGIAPVKTEGLWGYISLLVKEDE